MDYGALIIPGASALVGCGVGWGFLKWITANHEDRIQKLEDRVDMTDPKFTPRAHCDLIHDGLKERLDCIEEKQDRLLRSVGRTSNAVRWMLQEDHKLPLERINQILENGGT